MTTPHFAKLATDLLAEEEAPRAPSSEAEMRAVAAIEAALARRRRSRLVVRVAGALALAAAITAVLVGTSLRRTEPRLATPAPVTSMTTAAPAAIAATALEPAEGAMVAHNGRTESLSPSMTLTSGDRIEASPRGGTGIALADGSLVRIESGSEVSVKALSETRRFLLTRGSLHADVAKLGPDQRFIVETEDAEVEVHGTSFTVAIREASSGCSSRTHVDVTEGVVSVRSNGHEDRLVAGSSWPTCAAPAPMRTASASAPRAPAPGSATIAAPPPSSTASGSSALAAQNALFAKATAARRAGDGAAAVAAYDRLLAEYPDGFLAESAAVERMRVLDGMDHARGREAAAAYLARYPNGFARAEAQRIAP